MNHKVIIVGASRINDFSFLNHKESDCFYIACDGGYNCFLKNKIEPDLFVGDFDTLDQSLIASDIPTIKFNQIKDDTDTLFAIKKCLNLNYKEFHLYGCTGGKIDHTIANLQILSYLHNHNAEGYLYDVDQNMIIFSLFSGEEVIFNQESSGFLSIFSYSPKSYNVNEKNLKYELQNYTLSNDFPLGISNQFIGKKAKINLKEGILIITCPINSIKSIKRKF